MNITFNGKPHAVGAKASVTTLISQVTGRELSANRQAADGRRLGVAIARNSEVVPRGQWHSMVLAEGDCIELVTAIQGG
jgi:sulfur carrier protein